jgi:hypothetical protein
LVIIMAPMASVVKKARIRMIESLMTGDQAPAGQDATVTARQERLTAITKGAFRKWLRQ